ncbi:hypothetical protein BGZ72_009111 [Mortierella alpina]|nr:hypothetical protein BGZ72_009111 [Mortierella alpina]
MQPSTITPTIPPPTTLLALADSSFAENDLQALETSSDHPEVYFYKRGSKEEEEDSFSFKGSSSGSFKGNEVEKHKFHADHDRDHRPSKSRPQPNHGRKKPHPEKPKRSPPPHKRKPKPCPKRKPKPHKPKPHKPHKPHKPKPGKPHKPKPSDKPKPKPKPEPKPVPEPENPNPTPPATPSGAPGVGPTAPVIPPTQIGGGGGDNGGGTNPSGVVPPGATGTGGATVPEISGGAMPQPTSQLVAAPPTSTKMSGSSSSSLPAVIGAIVGTIALVGLFALAAYRRREKRRDQEEQTRPNPEMDEAPRTAFRHESFMALVKDAAQGFYAPGTEGPPRGGQSGVRSPSPLGASTAVASAGTGAIVGGDLSRQTSGRSQNSQHSLHSRRSGNYSGVNVNGASPPTTLPPLAHIGGRLSD